MNPRRFNAGDQFEIDGVNYRVVKGRKAVEDLRLDWWQDGRWRPVTLDHVGLIVDMIAENENVLYPPPRFKGGGMVIQFCMTAHREGWHAARNLLHQQRANKAEQGSLL
jgi:hypothetical protein